MAQRKRAFSKKTIIGLTGGIASGKSTVLNFMRQQGLRVLDADFVAREAVYPGTPASRDILKKFGPDVFSPDGQLNRVALGEIVFKNPAKRRLLERIIHPRVIDAIKKQIREAEGTLVVDVPLLFEAGLQKLCDWIIVVWVPQEIQKKRLIERNGLSEKQAKARLKAQWGLDRKKKLADFVIDNSGSLDETRAQTIEILGRIHAV